MPETTPTTPIVGTTPVAGQNLINQQAAAQQKRLTASQAREQALQKFADSKNSIFRRAYYKSIQSGSLTNFQYIFYKRDPYPLVLCTSIYASDGRIAGINLHYLTFKYIRYLIKQYCGKAFSYYQIKNNNFIYNAFRTYKRDGARMTKILDCNFLMNVLGQVRSFKPTEIEAIRLQVQKQLNAKMNPTAEELTQEYLNTVVPNPNDPRHSEIVGYKPQPNYGLTNTLDDARRNPVF